MFLFGMTPGLPTGRGGWGGEPFSFVLASIKNFLLFIFSPSLQPQLSIKLSLFIMAVGPGPLTAFILFAMSSILVVLNIWNMFIGASELLLVLDRTGTRATGRMNFRLVCVIHYECMRGYRFKEVILQAERIWILFIEYSTIPWDLVSSHSQAPLTNAKEIYTFNSIQFNASQFCSIQFNSIQFSSINLYLNSITYTQNRLFPQTQDQAPNNQQWLEKTAL